MSKKNEKMPDYVHELIAMGVESYVANVCYYDSISKNSVELYTWHNDPETCLSYILQMKDDLEHGCLIRGLHLSLGLIMTNIHVSDIHYCNSLVTGRLYNLSRQYLKLGVNFKDKNGVFLKVSQQNLAELYSITVDDSENKLPSIKIDSLLGSGGFIN